MKIDREADALLIVDFQNDFITGSLAVAGAEELVPVINQYIGMFDNVAASRDRHKENHPSFIDQGGPWPDHCVDGTFGMEIHTGLKFLDSAPLTIVDKGRYEEAYSAFTNTRLVYLLKAMKIKRLFICGLATDYCIKATVLDALKEFGSKVFLLTDAIAAVNIKPDDGKIACIEMAAQGAEELIIGDFE